MYLPWRRLNNDMVSQRPAKSMQRAPHAYVAMLSEVEIGSHRAGCFFRLCMLTFLHPCVHLFHAQVRRCGEGTAREGDIE